MEIIEVREGKGAVCERILRALPDWFGIERAIRDYVAAVEDMIMFGVVDGGPRGGVSPHPAMKQHRAEHDGFVESGEYPTRANREVVAFLALDRRTEVTAEIHVMGVTPEFRRRGLGHALVEKAATRAAAEGCRLLSVKTLAGTRPDPSYDQTRAFYLSQDFLPVEIFPTLWDEHNPCLLMVRILRACSEPGRPHSAGRP